MDLKRFVLAGLAVGALVAGCRPITDLNADCVLIKKCDGDGGVCNFTEREMQEKTGSSKDFISFGSTDCDDLTCVRDSSFPKDPDLDKPAHGYCSKACAGEGASCPSDTEKHEKDVPLHCRPLLLDAETLAAIKSDPVLGPMIGNVTAPFFCARSGADGGV